MGRSILSRINKIVFLAILSGLLFLTGSKPVSAAGDNSGKCKVVFADSRGVVSGDTYRKWGKTVDKGSYITLPKVKRSGYKCVWIEKNGKKENFSKYYGRYYGNDYGSSYICSTD